MINKTEHARIYRFIVDILEKTPLPRAALIERCINRMNIADKDGASDAGGVKSLARSKAGTILNEMHERGLVGLDNMGKYFLVMDRPIIVKIERCEREIIRALTDGKKTKSDLRDILRAAIGTDKTATTRDDDTLSTYMGQILKRMLAEGVAVIEEGYYTLSEKASARADDLNRMLALKTEFLQRLHSKGGEFFENYFMTLLSRYSKKHGKKVLECYVTGGSADGGIDGVMKTEDSLGFRETVMVQTKNRVEIATETDVRGFYGAVCAKRGTRGIYATTSTFHSAAREFMASLDDCIGLNGTAIFSMAKECSYGIKCIKGVFTVDDKLL